MLVPENKNRPSLDALVIAPPSPEQTLLTDLVYSLLPDGAVGYCDSLNEALGALESLESCGFIFLSHTFDAVTVASFSGRAKLTDAGIRAVFIQARRPGADSSAVDDFQLKDQRFAACSINQLN